ncbi:alpha/beta fold hydrolase [Glaciihabitans arcticus]|uniref:Alpha/beta fold hydrolase n=1 Tax=Glaciihabitans arcticus TaxID=2668039 RepID=A0A4Q9GPN7_9MICO|nr:alpha/beta fold hydrolase [Glaciihabitans arcticus]TBN56585.1 alpha/beta fold hydrolase [Glaciihabitans arcticus]
MMTMVLIPGGGGNASFWYRLAPLLRERGFEVLTPQLPSGDEAAGVDQYADAVIDAIGERDDVILVAQSLGGFTAAAVANRAPVRLIVFVSAMVPVSGETAGEWWAATGQADAARTQAVREGRDPDAEWDDAEIFYHDLSADVLEEVLAEGDLPQSMTPFASTVDDDTWRTVPVRAVAGAHDRLFPIDMMTRVNHERLGVATDVIDSGHLAALSQPEKLVELLAGYATSLRPS